MKTCDQYQFDIPDILDSTITEFDRAAFDDHIALCPECAEVYRQYRATLSVLTSYQRPERLYGGEDMFLDRLDQTLDEGQVENIRQKKVTAHTFNPFRWLPGSPARITAATAAALVAGMFLGQELFSPGSYLHQHQPEGSSSVVSGHVPEQSAEERAEQFIGRAERILLSLVNADIAEELPYRPSFDRQRTLSRALLNEAVYIREGLETEPSDHARLLDLMDNLEVVLMQIAALQTDYTADDLAFIQSSAERKAVLFKMNLDAVLAAGEPQFTTTGLTDTHENTDTPLFY